MRHPACSFLGLVFLPWLSYRSLPVSYTHLFGIVFLYAEEIAGLFHVPGASLSMRAMAPALFLVPLVASYRGYFQGMNNMIPTAVSQITEQLFRVAAGLTMAMFLKDNVWIFDGFTWQQRGAAGGCFGAAAGGLGGLLAILIMYLMRCV